MNLSNLSVNRIIRSLKFQMTDKKRISKLLNLIEKGNRNAAIKYLHHLLRNTQTSKYLIAYNLTVGNYKKPQLYGFFLEMFISKTGSSCGHGQKHSAYSPIYWLFFFKGNTFEIRFFVNPHSFQHNPAIFELEVEVDEKGGNHSISEIEYTKLPNTSPNISAYSIPIHYGNQDKKISFPLLIEKPCKIKIYHCVKGGNRNLILEEEFEKL